MLSETHFIERKIYSAVYPFPSSQLIHSFSPLLGAGQVSQREGRPAPQDQEQPQGEAQEEQEEQEEEVPERLRRVGGGQRLRLSGLDR